MDALFNGQPIFGTQTRNIGPQPKPTVQRERIPGVAGFRVYNLGTESVIWEVSGLVVGGTIAALEDALFAAAGYMDGGLYAFATTGGSVFEGCLLQSFNMAGEITPMDGYIDGAAFEGFCVRVRAVVEWSQPQW
jgi:hypothetical protein